MLEKYSLGDSLGAKDPSHGDEESRTDIKVVYYLYQSYHVLGFAFKYWLYSNFMSFWYVWPTHQK